MHHARTNSGTPTPATVWACGQTPIDPDAAWPTPVVKKIVTSFTAPGAQVALLPWPSAASLTGRALDRDQARPPRSDSNADLDDAVAAIRGLDRTVHLLRVTPSQDSGSACSPSWTDVLSTPPRAGSADTATYSPTDGLAPDVAHLDLIITSLDPVEDPDTAAVHLALTASRWLRAGGILTVLTHSDWTRGELIDPTGPVVAAAQSADLLYLQHVVVLLAPIRDGAFVIDTEEHSDADETRGLPTPHRRVHADLVVLVQPRDHQAPSCSPAAAATETGDLR